MSSSERRAQLDIQISAAQQEMRDATDAYGASSSQAQSAMQEINRLADERASTFSNN